MKLVGCRELKKDLRDLVVLIVDFRVLLEKGINLESIDQLRQARDKVDEQTFMIWQKFYPGLADLMDMYHQRDGNMRINDFQYKRNAWKWFHENFQLNLKERRVEMEGNLRLNFFSREMLPKNFTLIGDFHMEPQCEIKELPENFTIMGNCEIWGTDLKHLPNGFIVKGNLTVTDTLEDLPDDLRVGGILRIPPKFQDKAWQLDAKGFVNKIKVM